MKTTPKQTLVLTLPLREQLKHPLGTLLRGTSEETMKKLSRLIAEEKPKCIISVGDVVSQNMLRQGIKPLIVVVDNKVMRENSGPINAAINKEIIIKNPAGTLTPQAWIVIQEAVKQSQPTLVRVEGEEDLLALIAVLEAPKNALVVYGQPHEGVVAAKTDKQTKGRVQQIIDNMEPPPKS
jgi:uncharacterized protein (UPF0218 family)